MSSPLKQNTTIIQELLNTINNLPEAGSVEPVLQEKTVTPSTSSQTIKADSGYDGLDTVTVNAMPTATQATPSITVNASGLITATATQTAGYVAAGSKSATKQLAFQPAKTITPSTTSQIAVSSGYYTGGNITVAGDSDLVAENIKSGVNIFGVTGTYVGSGGSGGDTSAEDGLIDRTCSVYTNDRVTSIGRYAFGYCSSLTSVSFPAATRIGSYAFYSCSNLTSVSFPAATIIYSYAFGYCSSLTSVSFPKVTYIYSYAFYGCYSLTSVNFPAATYISPGAFGGKCSRLISVNFPVATTISDDAFHGCSGLISVNFPKVKIIGNYAFENCYSLTSVSFPDATRIYSNAFTCCSSLTSVSFPKVTYISYYAFLKCYNLKSLYLTGSSLCKLANSHAFSSTPIGGYSTSAGTYGSIYVPASLLTSYKEATNWTYFSSRFVGI